MPHNKQHIGSANEDATTYGMPRREAIVRGRQHMSLMTKSKESLIKSSDRLQADPSLKNLNALRKQSNKTKNINKSGKKIADRLAATKPKKLPKKNYN